jgi:hypothetical protein
MIARLIASLLGDTVFKWAVSTGRSFETEITRYLDGRGVASAREAKKATSH